MHMPGCRFVDCLCLQSLQKKKDICEKFNVVMGWPKEEMFKF